MEFRTGFAMWREAKYRFSKLRFDTGFQSLEPGQVEYNLSGPEWSPVVRELSLM